MPHPSSASITILLERAAEGDKSARDRLVSLVSSEIHARAVRAMAGQPPGHLLQPTALVNEVWLRLLRCGAKWKNRSHFLAVAAQAMRHILIDHARLRRNVGTSQSEAALTLDNLISTIESDTVDLLALNDALTSLAAFDAAAARLVELRLFIGASPAQCADILGISPRTAARRYQFAKSWLRKNLE